MPAGRDTLEAQAFAYLSVCMLNGLPINFPKATDAPKPLTGRGSGATFTARDYGGVVSSPRTPHKIQHRTPDSYW